MMQDDDQLFLRWVEGLRYRHSESLTFAEIRKGVTALSRIYVQERGRIAGDAFGGAGKRAAFASFYTPLHFLLVRAIVDELHACEPMPHRILDLGCGLAPAGAAWSLACRGAPRVFGIDRRRWVVREARFSLEALSVRGTIRDARVEALSWPRQTDAIVAAFSVNELSADARKSLLEKMLAARRASILVVEPIARTPSPWWSEWSAAFRGASGRDDDWRFRIELPEWLAALDRAARLDHRELTGRSLFLRRRS